MHRMTELMIFTAASEKEARLTHIKIEAFQTAIPEAHNRILFTYITFGLMFCRFGSGQSM